MNTPKKTGIKLDSSFRWETGEGKKLWGVSGGYWG
jgi:hypothetical protein